MSELMCVTKRIMEEQLKAIDYGEHSKWYFRVSLHNHWLSLKLKLDH